MSEKYTVTAPLEELLRVSVAVPVFLLAIVLAAGTGHLFDSFDGELYLRVVAALLVIWLALPQLLSRIGARASKWVAANVVARENSRSGTCPECSDRCRDDVFWDNGTHAATNPVTDKNTKEEVGK